MITDLIRRNIPAFAHRFETETIPAQNGCGVYEVDGDGERVLLRGDNTISLAMAFYRYLKEYCAVNWSWCGNREIHIESLPIPTKRTRRVIPQKHRVYMNYCTLGYSAPFWDWKRWEKELDFMAMNGINMPLCVIGTEAVWFETLLELGFTHGEALSYLSGPAYWPWQLMTNIEGVLPPREEAYVYRRLELGKKILARQLELGMTPIGQGYSGHVPRLLCEKYPQAKITKTGKWCGFPETYQLDPLDPLFETLGSTLLQKQKELLGNFRYLASDPFHENQPSSKMPGYLRRVGKAIDRLYRTAQPDSVWVMQSWSLRKPIVKAVPKDRLLILNINGQDAGRKKQFWGYSYVLGNLMNYGGKNSLHGDIAALAKNPYLLQKERNPALCGTGLFMEGINQNPLYYDLLFDTLTCKTSISLSDWLRDYARRRYHSEDACLLDALALLQKSCYGGYRNAEESGSIVCARPAPDVTRAAPNDSIGVRYDNAQLSNAVGKFLQSAAPPTDGFLFDLCDTLRQALSNYAETLFKASMEAFHAKNKQEFIAWGSRFLSLLQDLDRLLMTREELTLRHWVEDAMKEAKTEEEAEDYRKNALMLITIWGPEQEPQIFDYAWKEWGGLIKEYYLPRWKIFFQELTEHFENEPRTPSKALPLAYGRPAFRAGALQKKLADFELNFLASYRPAPCVPEDTLKVSRALFEKYAPALTKSASAVVTEAENNLDFWRK